MQIITKRLKNFKREKRGISNVIVIMLSLVLIVIVVSNVVLWSYQMNQLDWEKMQEKIEIAKVERATRSWWLKSSSEYAIRAGSRLNGTYMDTWNADDAYERFEEELTMHYTPSGYILTGSTTHVAGSTADLATDNGVYMIFRSYPSAFSQRTLYAHLETTVIAGSPYYQLKLNSSDATGIDFQADASTTGRKLMGKFVYPLAGITEISGSTWTIHYRAYKTGPNTVAHCDVDIVIRKSDGTVRTVIANDAANSLNLGTSWSTVSAEYSWNSYTVIDDTDFLEVDYFAHVTTNQANRRVYLRTDDSTLPVGDQTRITGIMFPSVHRAEIELTGSGNVQDWQSLTWMVDDAFTIGNVNVTLQLYNYNVSQYSTNGDGYVSYVSSSTPNSDELQSQTIITNSTHFRGLAGEWKIKISGAKQTMSRFDMKIDWAEFEVRSPDSYTLDIAGVFVLDLSTFPLAYVNSLEIQIRYRANDSLENWCLKGYNWTNGEFSCTGFNSTEHLPSANFTSYTVNMTNAWRNYVQSNNGTIRVKFSDTNPDATQTTVDVDFLGLAAIIDGTKFHLQNKGATTSHIVAVWLINATMHARYSANFFLNSGDEADYLRADLRLPKDGFVIKVVTERGNTAVFRNV